MIYALDSDIISAILKRDVEIIARFHKIRPKNEFVIPPIVFYEIERGLLSGNLLAKRRIFMEFCKDVEIGEFSFNVWQKAAEIYATLSKQGNPIGGKYDGDYFIAAYCVVNDYTLITGNKDHFNRIDGLKFTNWK